MKQSLLGIILSLILSFHLEFMVSNFTTFSFLFFPIVHIPSSSDFKRTTKYLFNLSSFIKRPHVEKEKKEEDCKAKIIATTNNEAIKKVQSVHLCLCIISQWLIWFNIVQKLSGFCAF